MISIRYSIPPPLISRYTSVISEATGFNYIAIRRHIVGFNPCFLEGRDYRCKTAKLISKPFQSTLPRRERLGSSSFVAVAMCFNPRSHEGSDRVSDEFLYATEVSIHAPTKGATPATPNLRATRRGFNPRSHEGSDHPLLGSIRSGPCRFNPRSHEGSDVIDGASGQKIMVSIHAPAKGATVLPKRNHSGRKFQSTLPRRERRYPRNVFLSVHRFQSTLPRRERPPNRAGSDAGT